MRASIPLLLACLMVPAAAQQPLAAEEIPPKIKAYLEEADRQKAEAIERMAVFIKKHAKSPNMKASVADTKKALRNLRRSKEPFIPTLPIAAMPGQIGRLYHSRVHVEQVVDDDEMLIQAHWVSETLSVLGKPGDQIVVPDFETHEVLLWVRGVSTSDASDDAGFELPQVFEVTGNHSYETVLGASKTVLVIEPFDVAQVEHYRALAKMKPKPRKAAPKKSAPAGRAAAEAGSTAIAAESAEGGPAELLSAA